MVPFKFANRNMVPVFSVNISTGTYNFFYKNKVLLRVTFGSANWISGSGVANRAGVPRSEEAPR